jgi:hypothetical protein
MVLFNSFIRSSQQALISGVLTNGRPLKGQRDIGDLFSPFFRVRFSNVTKADVAKQKDSRGNLKKGEAESLAIKEKTKASLDAKVFSNEQESLRPIEQDEDTFEIDSRLLPKTAASLKLETKVGAATKFTLTLTPTYDDGIRILNSRLLHYGTFVSVQWGYTSWDNDSEILSDVFVFRNTFPKAEFGQDISIIVSGHDLTASVGSRNSRKRRWDFNEYTSDFLIVKKIVERTLTEVDVTGVPKDSNFLTGKNRKRPEARDKRVAGSLVGSHIRGEIELIAPDERVAGSIHAMRIRGSGVKNLPSHGIQQDTNDWAFVRRLLNDHGLSFTAQGNKFRIFSLFDGGTKTNYSYRFLWRQEPKTGRDIPVYNIRGNLMPLLFLPAEGSGVVSFTFDADTGKSKIKAESPVNRESSNLSSSEKNNKVIGGEGAGQITETNKDGTTLRGITRPQEEPGGIAPAMTTPNRAHNSSTKAKKQVNDAVAFSHPQVGINAPGVVDMMPNIIVMLEGTSKLFDGPYRVRDATHTISSSGYDMELVLLRHSVKGQGDKKTDTPPTVVKGEGKTDDTETAVPEDPSIQNARDAIKS